MLNNRLNPKNKKSKKDINNYRKFKSKYLLKSY
jgi:hypothetical protein